MPDTTIPFIPRTKLRPPRLPGDLLLRPRLLERLERPQILSLVLAPAGYGKTTLVSSWLAQREQPAAWISLESADNTPGAFVAALAAAVQGVCPAVSGALLDLLGRGTSELASSLLLTTVLNGLDQLRHDFVLVLDDFHYLVDPAIQELVWGILTYPPRALHLVLTARHDPPIPPRIRYQGTVTEIRAHEMGFTAAEAGEFLRQAVARPIDTQAVAMLVEQAAGWIVPLRLSAAAASQIQDAAALKGGIGTCQRAVLDYLEAEVLAPLSHEVQTFLLCTSLLPQFNASLCDAILDTVLPGVDSAAMLKSLEQSELFIQRLDIEGDWYQYHPLFRKLVQRLLHLEYDGGQIAALDAKAQSWYAQRRQRETTRADTICARFGHATECQTSTGTAMKPGEEDAALQLAKTTGAALHVDRSMHGILTFREMDVLRQLNRRMTNKEIAHELRITPETVRQHTVNIYRKLGVANRRQAIVQASAWGLIVEVQPCSGSHLSRRRLQAGLASAFGIRPKAS